MFNNYVTVKKLLLSIVNLEKNASLDEIKKLHVAAIV